MAERALVRIQYYPRGLDRVRFDSFRCCIRSRFFLDGYGVSYGSNTLNRTNRAFVCLFLGFFGLYLLAQYINGSKRGMLYLSALSIALSSLTRYAGLIFVLTGTAALICLNTWHWKRKLIRASLFLILSALPLLAWVIRNKLSAGNAVNRTFAVHLPGIKDLAMAVDAVCLWLFPVTLLGEAIWPRLLILLVVIGVLSWSATKMVLLNSRLHQICVLFIVGYAAFIFVSRSLLDAAIPLDTRMLAPAYLQQ